MTGPLGADANIGATEEEAGRFRGLTAFGQGKVLLHTVIPSSISSKWR